jgi:hypothetical protein
VIGQVLSKKINWLPFTTPLIAYSVIHKFL